MNLNKIYSRH